MFLKLWILPGCRYHVHGGARVGERAFRLHQFRLLETVHRRHRHFATVQCIGHAVLSFMLRAAARQLAVARYAGTWCGAVKALVSKSRAYFGTVFRRVGLH